MKIGIDIRMLAEGKRTGIEGYVLNLLSHLFEIDKKNQYKLFFNAFKKPKINLQKIFNYQNVQLCTTRLPNKILNLSFIFLNFPKIDRLLNVDIFFAPNIAFYALSKKCKSVITFHDLAFLLFPHFYSMRRRLWHFLAQPKRLAERADRIIAVSSITKNDLISLFKISPKKIEVIYSGIEEKFQFVRKREKLEKIRKKYQLPKKFILFLGALEPRKNLIGLISAFAHLKKKEKKLPYKLVIAGSPGWRFKNIFKIAKELPVKNDVIFTGAIDEEDKPYLYNLASLFVFPSFYEGFGFPPLEAMACSVPVITSAISALPEICGDAALLIDPYNVEEITETMYQCLFDIRLRENLIKRGLEQVNKFKWNECARKVLAVFEELGEK